MLTKFKENQRIERWKDTPFRHILSVDWVPPTVLESPGPINAVLPENAVILTIYNGKVSARWIHDQQLPDDLLVRFDNNKLDIHIVENAVVQRPIVIHHISESSDDQPSHIQCEITITVESKAQASLLMLESGSGQYLNTPKVRMTVEEEAKIEWVRVSLNSELGSSVLDFKCEQEQHSHFHYVSYQSRGKLVRSDIGIRMNGEDTYTQLYVLNIGDKEQHLAHVVDIDHATANCLSSQQVKNILKDHSESLFDAQIKVFRDAQKINADQMTRSLILDDGARALTIPRLEIYADDVRCTHGATVGYLDPEQLFYLQSRGIALLEAKKILMQAYGAEIIEGIENSSIEQWLNHILDQDIIALA